MQFPVPKNIDLEDKIVGPMTLRQFLYVLVGCSVAYAIFKRLAGPGQNNGLALMISIPIALLSLAMAFVKIQERPFGDFLASLFIFMIRPRQRIWRRQEAVQGLITENEKKKEEKLVKKELKVNEVSDLTKILDGEK